MTEFPPTLLFSVSHAVNVPFDSLILSQYLPPFLCVLTLSAFVHSSDDG